MKTYGMILITMIAVRTEREIRALAWVTALSLGFYGFKGGLFTLLSGGGSHVYGPDDSYISDNNALALALITALPLIWYLQTQATKRWLRLAFTALAALTLISAAGSYSRGALLAGGAMLAFLWLKSRTKVRTGLALLLIAPLVYFVMPEQWFDRMQTIDNYQADASSMGRINAWGFAMNVAGTHPLGGGYAVFTARMFMQFAPDPTNFHAAHSIYFQVLGEHGVVGLVLFLLLLFFAWRTGSRVIARCKDRPDLKWARDLAAMGQVSLVGYAVGGAFLTLAYYDLVYYIVAIMVVLERLLAQQAAVAAPGAPAPAGLRAVLRQEAA
jgi:probable O-glycosylation ligase (exosortase A-associated)